MISNLLIDLDGTLTDPKRGILNCVRHALEQLKKRARVMKIFFGLSDRHCAKAVNFC